MQVKKKFTNKNINILLYVVMLLYYTLIFCPVLRSGYMYDDLYNYISKGYAILHDCTLWEMTVSIARAWYEQIGRTFFFTWYMYIFFSFVGLHAYKFIIVFFTFLNGVLLKKFICNFVKNNIIAWLTVLFFPILVNLNCNYANSMYGFHMLLQLTLLWNLLGWIFFDLYCQSSKKIWQFLSCLFLFIALGTYEVSYILCFIYVVISFCNTEKIWSAIKKILPQFIIGCFWMLLNIYASLNALNQYDGTTVNLSANCFGTFFRQLSGSTCIVNNLEYFPALKKDFALLKQYIPRYFIISIFILLLFCLLQRSFHKQIKMKNSNMDKKMKGLYLIAVWIIIGPTILIALSAKYQLTVTWGNGYLPVYISTWGGAMLMGCILERFIIKKQAYLTLLIFIGLVCIPNQMVADLSVNRVGNISYLSDELWRKAAKTGMFDEWTIEEPICDGTNSWVAVDQHYCYLLGYKVSAFASHEILTNDEQHDYLNNTPNGFQYIVSDGNDKCLLCFKGIHLDILNNNENIPELGITTKEVYVFCVVDSDFSHLAFVNSKGYSEVVYFSNENNINSSVYGKLYHIVFNQPIYAGSVIIY